MKHPAFFKIIPNTNCTDFSIIKAKPNINFIIRIRPFIFLCFVNIFMWAHHAYSQKITLDRNKPERLEWYHNLAFGLMIHWSVDAQLGGSMSHNVAASSKDYQDFYFKELPKTFDPKDFDPEKLARTTKLAGINYVIVTAKHHNGFCMWDTKTSDFNIMNTAYGKDVLKEIIEALRAQNIAIGLSFSPDDFYVMYRQGHPISRETPESSSTVNTELWENNKKQLSELLTNYGKIDILYIDENNDWANPLVANYAWDLEPDLLITKGGMESYRSFIPEEPKDAIWETVIPNRENWKNDYMKSYKSSNKLVNMLIETRAKGGNFVLEMEFDAQGSISEIEQQSLQKMALWNAANREAILNVKPCKVVNEQDTWFTQSNDDRYIYAFVHAPYWNWMEERAFFIRSLQGNAETKVRILGQSDEMMEYHVHRSPKPILSIVEEGIFVTVIKAQQLDKNWNFPVVLRFEAVKFKD